MSPNVSKPERSAEDEDMLIVSKQFEALKMMDNGVGGQQGSHRNMNMGRVNRNNSYNQSNTATANGTGTTGTTTGTNGALSSEQQQPRPEYVISSSDTREINSFGECGTRGRSSSDSNGGMFGNWNTMGNGNNNRYNQYIYGGGYQ